MQRVRRPQPGETPAKADSTGAALQIENNQALMRAMGTSTQLAHTPGLAEVQDQIESGAPAVEVGREGAGTPVVPMAAPPVTAPVTMPAVS